MTFGATLNPGLDTIDIGQQRWGQDLPWRALIHDSAIAQYHELIRMPRSQRDVMQNDHSNQPMRLSEFAHAVHHPELIVQIERTGRFIEQQYLWPPRDQLSESHQLALTAGKLVQLSIGEVRNSNPNQCGMRLSQQVGRPCVIRYPQRRDDPFKYTERDARR